MKIVIADDSDMVRERIKESLKNISTVEIVGEATNGKEAVKIIHEVSPDFVLLDIRMPELNGIEVLKKIKSRDNKIKVCVFTNFPFLPYKTKCAEEGADYFFDKNENIQVIRNLIEQLSLNVQVGKDA
ncbi:MAG: response regulator transcription factor [Ignavibacteriales bacterium]|nr:response regulator transcription factor [Ignavibacteriales bacterium]RJQ61834.1 MAG: DNA-binding response regulator [Stygiobacter sp.]